MNDGDIARLSFVKRGRQRRTVLSYLTFKPTLVSEVEKGIARLGMGKPIRLGDVSRALRDLQEEGLVDCLNPPTKRGDRGVLYRLTKKGEQIKRLL